MRLSSLFIVEKINRDYPFLTASLSSIFTVRIESLISTGSQSVGDFVSSKLSPRIRSHLVFQSSCDSSNTSYWKVV